MDGGKRGVVGRRVALVGFVVGVNVLYDSVLTTSTSRLIIFV